MTFSTVPLSEITHAKSFTVPSFDFHGRMSVRFRSENKSFTCADEHDIVLSVGGADSVHGDLREAVVHVGSDEDGPSAHGVDRIVHQRVVTGKLDHIVRETFRGFKAAERLAGTLQGGDEVKFNA